MTAAMTPHHEPPFDPWQSPSAGGDPADPAGTAETQADDDGPGLRTELRQAAFVALALTVAGIALGLLWLWLAPRVPLVSDGKAVFFKNSEGEEAVGADGTFVLIAAGFGVLTGAAVFLFFRRGGVPLVIGTAVGGLLGSLVAWRLGVWLGPTQDVAAHARAVGKGTVFDAPLQLRAKGALLAWPIVAAAVHLGLTGLFGPRDGLPAEDGHRE